MIAIRNAVTLTTIAALLALAGCDSDSGTVGGYQMGSLYPDNVKTVAVPVWRVGRSVYRRGLQFRLTEAIIKQLEGSAGYKVVSASRADTILEGRIDSVEQQVLSVDPATGLSREMEITYVISYTWKDLRTGKKLKEISNFRVAGTYIPQAPFNEDFFQGSEDLTNRAARRIVESLERDF